MSVLNLIATVLNILALIVLVRVLLSWFPNINPHNPLVVVIRAIADPIIAPFRGMLPTFAGMLDLSPLIAIIILESLAQVFQSLAYDYGLSIGFVVVSAVEQLVLTLIIIVCIIVLLRLVISLFHADPWHPMTMAIREMSRPFVRPFTGMMSRSVSVDTASLFAFIAYLILYFVAQAALNQLAQLLL
ncbi:MAG: YggT family protein [Candidatus Dormibacteria bacterium]